MITYENAIEWLQVRIKELNNEGLPVSSIGITTFGTFGSWSIQGAGFCAFGKSLDDAIKDFRIQINADPANEARKKREEAAQLLSQAEQLEGLAAGKAGA